MLLISIEAVRRLGPGNVYAARQTRRDNPAARSQPPSVNTRLNDPPTPGAPLSASAAPAMGMTQHLAAQGEDSEGQPWPARPGSCGRHPLPRFPRRTATLSDRDAASSAAASNPTQRPRQASLRDQRES